MAPARRFAIVMAGGSGTRFWPRSRRDLPKQFLDLAGERSMLAETVARLSGIVPPQNVFVVTGKAHRRLVRREVPEVPAANVLAEPVGRNTAPCIAWGTAEVLRRREDAVVAVLAADHRIGGGPAFGRDLLRAFDVADRSSCLVTFGIRPDRPATGYGYLRVGAAAGGGARRVEAFVEKPDAARARRYLASGRYLWNSGMFVWRADAIRDEIAAHLPRLARAIDGLDRLRRRGGVPAEVLARRWPRLDAVSIDHGVLEHSDRVVTLPARFRWSDLGSWDSVAEEWPADRRGNASRDPLLCVDARNNIVSSAGKPVVLLGVDGVVVVDAGDALLVCRRERCEDLRDVVARLEKAGMGDLR